MNLVHLLLRNARSQPERPALAVGTKVVLTYGELALRVQRLASGFRKRFSLKSGDRVALAMRNCPEYYEILFACWHAGLTAVPINAKLHAKEFAYIIENSGAKRCFVNPELESSGDGISILNFKNIFGEPESPADLNPAEFALLFFT